MRFSLCFEMFYPQLDVVERLRPIKEAGFDQVEFWSPYDKDLDALRREALRLGLGVARFSGHRNHSPVIAGELEGFLGEIEQNIKAAQALGCPQLIVLSDALQTNGAAKCADLPDEQQWNNLQSALEQATLLAERGRIQLCLEPLNLYDHPDYFLHRCEPAFEQVRTIDSPQLKVLFDVYHAQRSQGRILETIAQHVEDIACFHLADVPGRFEPGTGELHYPNILTAIEGLGFEGTIGFECLPQHDEASALKAIRSLIEPFT